MSDDIQHFYDALADDYDLLFDNWRQASRWQGNILDHLIRSAWRGDSPPHTVLDCTCGIGTQALGLARHDYHVTATDLSPQSVARAAREAEAMGLPLITGIADLRTLSDQVEGPFDVVLSADNALPHLRGSELRMAIQQIHNTVAPGGMFLGTIRDYDILCQERPHLTGERVLDTPEGRRIVFQVWDWAEDGHCYTVNQFIVREGESGWQTSHYATTYYPMRRELLTAVLSRAGFSDVTWVMPEESGFYQPIVIAWKA